MGSYTELCVAGFPVYSTKSYVDSTVMTIFRETDKVIEERKRSQLNPLIYSDIEDDEETETIVEYSATVAQVIDRLNIMGFTLESSKSGFDVGVKEKLDTCIEWAADGSGAWLRKDIELLKGLTFEKYMVAITYIYNNKLVRWMGAEELPADSSELVKYIFNDHDYEMHFGFSTCDIRCFLRAILEIVPENEKVIQDITSLVYAGYYGIDDNICEQNVDDLIDGFIADSRILILTEGSSDRHILEGALNLLYPHLSGYYSFMDFGVSRAAGGAPALVNTIKAFVGAGLGNRVIALFDNDTAAKCAQKLLKEIDLPSNIRVLNYPSIDLGKSYPTLGPAGLSNLNINGLAGSIEMYLGKDVLMEEGQLIPVQWKGYDSSLGQYQGEILNKGNIQKRYYKKLKLCSNNPDEISACDWSGLDLILKLMFECFEE